MKSFFKVIGDFFLDHDGYGDEKRLLGIGLIIFACFYVAMIKVGDLTGFLAISGVGTTLLGLGIAGDKVNQSSAPTSPPAT